MLTTAAGVTDAVHPPESASSPLVRFVALPAVAAAASAGFGAILAWLLGVTPLLAVAAGAAYFCFLVASASILLDIQSRPR